MQNRLKYKTGWGFVDLLFNLLIGFAFLFIVAFLLINPITKKQDFDPKAEYLLIMTWNDESKRDVDMWIKDSLNNIVSFKGKDLALITLDRDDLGIVNDTFVNDQGVLIERKINREVISIKTKDPRRYIVTVHLYHARAFPTIGLMDPHGQEGPETTQTDTPTSIVINEKVKVELIRVNPWRLLKSKEVVLTDEGQELHAFEFDVMKDGFVETEETGKLIIYDANRLKKQW
jgi:hypothetical protein